MYAFAENNYRIGANAAEKQDTLKKLQQLAQQLGISYDNDSNEVKSISNALNLAADVYFFDEKNYIFSFTPIKTGPGCVRASVSNIIKADDNGVLFSVNPNVHLLLKNDLSPFKQSGLEWTDLRIIRYSSISNALNVVLNSIKFEINQLGYLRLDDHISNFAASVKCTYEIAANNLLSALEKFQLNYTQVRAIQFNFYHPSLLDFYNHHSIEYSKTFLFPSIDVGIIDYKQTVLKVLSVAELKKIQINPDEVGEKFLSEEKEEIVVYKKIMGGLTFFEFATDYCQKKLNNSDLSTKEKNALESSLALYTIFLKEQLNIYENVLSLASIPIENNDLIENMQNGLIHAQAKVTSLLELLHDYIKIKDINEEEDLDWNEGENNKATLNDIDITEDIDWEENNDGSDHDNDEKFTPGPTCNR